MNVKISKKKLSDVICFDDILNLFKHFTKLTGIDVSLHNVDGLEMLSYRSNPSLSICELVNDKKTKCNLLMRYSGLKALELGSPYTFQCGTMVKCSVALLVDEEYIGSIACGPVLLWEVDDIAKKEINDFLKNYCTPKHGFEQVLTNVKQLTPDNMRSAAKMLNLIVDYMIKEESLMIKQQNQISSQQNQIADLLIEKKVNAATVETIEKKNKLNQYSMSLEKELVSFIQMGENENANAIINNILGEIFAISSGDLDTIKANIFELFALLMRAAVDVGVKLIQLKNVLNKVSEILSAETKYDNVCFLTSEVMKEINHLIYENRSKKKSNDHLIKAISYIRNNFQKNISLDIVSKEVFVSSYYLSHLFRDEMDLTFVDYVNKVRIDRSKELLRNSKMNINEIASTVGFSDQNYFAKTFKKYVGSTPSKYIKIFK
ncbi:MAG: helix-turn-helix domain-containing protein [Tenericutes bacterium]|nr:helix-turn-helix domain-containing protein [Mycoplasmatota bacterium]